jgi:hypothetical protein
MRKEYRNLIIIAVVYLALLLLFIGKYDFNVSSTIQLSSNHLKNFDGIIPAGVMMFNHSGFDGQYYFMMALNPSLEKVHIAPHFLQRIVYPILTYIFSLGIPEIMPFMMVLINFMVIILSSCIVMIILKKYKANLNLVFLWAFCVGLLISFTKNLSEPLMMLFIVFVIYFFEKERHFLASLFLALAILTRELGITVYAAILLYFVIKRDLKKFGIYALAIIPFLLGEIVLFYKTGVIPMFISYVSIAHPISPLVDYLSNKPNEIGITLNMIKDYILNFIPNLSNFSAFRTDTLVILRNMNFKYSSIFLLLFAFYQLILMIKNFIKDKKITIYTLILLSQIVLIFSLGKSIFSFSGIDALGRYAIGLFLFSILYTAEKQKKYSKFLAILSMLLSAIYFIIIIVLK